MNIETKSSKYIQEQPVPSLHLQYALCWSPTKKKAKHKVSG